jgi:hypothetical protein
MDTKEQLLYFFLQGKISLSQYDQKFLSNLQMICHEKNRVTSNQVALFDRLVSKYSKQLYKNNVDHTQVITLPWKADIVPSTPEYTGAKVSYDDNLLTIRLPFNKTFISDFRSVNDNPFVWSREEKKYVAEFSTYALKIAYTLLPGYFPIVMYCDKLLSLLNQLSIYENVKVWEPTLVRVNGNLIVAGVNSILGDIIANMELKHNARTFYELSQLGIKIDPSLIDSPKLQFASEFVTEVNLDEFSEVAKWIIELNPNEVLFGRGLVNRLDREIREILDKEINTGKKVIDSRISRTSRPILLQYHSQPDTKRNHGINAIGKCVIIRNIRPIEVR